VCGAAQRLAGLQETRRTLEKLFGSALKKSIIPRTETTQAAPAPEVLACIDSYWPAVAQLALSVEADPEAVRLCDSFTVEWPSPLTRVAIKVTCMLHRCTSSPWLTVVPRRGRR